MQVNDALRRSGVGVRPGDSLYETAAVMEASGVGAVVVCEGAQPVGVVTDRDLVRRGLARRLPADTRVDAVMSAPAATVPGDSDLDDAYVAFRAAGVRRLVVVGPDGSFRGLLSVDDLLLHLAAHLRDVTRPVSAEIHLPHHDSPLPVA